MLAQAYPAILPTAYAMRRGACFNTCNVRGHIAALDDA
jgi:hypothetical protein